MTRRAGRLTFRDRLRHNDATLRFLGEMAGREVPAALLNNLAPKRVYQKGDPSTLEAATLRAVGELLARHPKVLFAVRQNSGSMQYTNTKGDAVPVWFVKIIRQPAGVRVKMPDYWGFIVGNGCVPFAIECKRASWERVSNEREEAQAAFLGMVRGIGGIGIFATDAQQVAAALDSA